VAAGLVETNLKSKRSAAPSSDAGVKRRVLGQPITRYCLASLSIFGGRPHPQPGRAYESGRPFLLQFGMLIDIRLENADRLPEVK
jgi:hypothetical protein